MGKTNLWRDSSREVKFFMFDSKLSIIFLIWMLNIGYNTMTFFRFIHTKLIKNKAYGKPRWFRRSYF